jgi:hypothetical protein
MAAQSVQRSAFADGSNYQRWWGVAQAIFNKGLKKGKGGSYTAGGGAGFVAGKGGKHRPISGPVTNGLHGGPLLTWLVLQAVRFTLLLMVSLPVPATLLDR